MWAWLRWACHGSSLPAVPREGHVTLLRWAHTLGLWEKQVTPLLTLPYHASGHNQGQLVKTGQSRQRLWCIRHVGSLLREGAWSWPWLGRRCIYMRELQLHISSILALTLWVAETGPKLSHPTYPEWQHTLSMDLSKAPRTHLYSMLFEGDNNKSKKGRDKGWGWPTPKGVSLSLYHGGISTRAGWVASVSLQSEMRNASQVGLRAERPHIHWHQCTSLDCSSGLKPG